MLPIQPVVDQHDDYTCKLHFIDLKVWYCVPHFEMKNLPWHESIAKLMPFVLLSSSRAQQLSSLRFQHLILDFNFIFYCKTVFLYLINKIDKNHK
jgi:hypothetical protein